MSVRHAVGRSFQAPGRRRDGPARRQTKCRRTERLCDPANERGLLRRDDLFIEAAELVVVMQNPTGGNVSAAQK